MASEAIFKFTAYGCNDEATRQQQAPCGSPLPLRQGFRGYFQFHYRVAVMSLLAQHSDRAAEATFT